jgi:hypothetical protein
MRSSIVWIGAMGVFTAIAGCTADVDPRLETRATTELALDRDSDRFVTVRLDFRRCAAPYCGGYFVQEVNVDKPSAYVTELVFDGPGLDDATIQSIRKAKLSELILRGHLGPVDPTYRTRTFVAREAYRGLPGRSAQSTHAFYYIEKRVPPIACITTPCPNQIAVELNAAKREDIDRVSLEEATAPFVDESWLTERTAHGSALVSGSLTEATPTPGTERLLIASQVFLRLPERSGPCPDQRTPSCGEQAVAFLRTADRCLVFDRCVERAFCPDFVPVCAEGYTRVSWPAAPSGCTAFACDPSFATAQNAAAPWKRGDGPMTEREAHAASAAAGCYGAGGGGALGAALGTSVAMPSVSAPACFAPSSTEMRVP